MLKKLSLLFILILVISCNYDKKPEYIKTEKIEVQNTKNGIITVSANVYFKNLNDFGGKIVTDSVDVYLENIKVGKVNAEEFKVPARDTFAIPVTASFDVMKKVKQNSSAIGENFINILLKRKFSLRFKGPITFSKGPLFYTYDLDQTNDIKF